MTLSFVDEIEYFIYLGGQFRKHLISASSDWFIAIFEDQHLLLSLIFLFRLQKLALIMSREYICVVTSYIYVR